MNNEFFLSPSYLSCISLPINKQELLITSWAKSHQSRHDIDQRPYCLREHYWHALPQTGQNRPTFWDFVIMKIQGNSAKGPIKPSTAPALLTLLRLCFMNSKHSQADTLPPTPENGSQTEKKEDHFGKTHQRNHTAASTKSLRLTAHTVSNMPLLFSESSLHLNGLSLQFLILLLKLHSPSSFNFEYQTPLLPLRRN